MKKKPTIIVILLLIVIGALLFFLVKPSSNLKNENKIKISMGLNESDRNQSQNTENANTPLNNNQNAQPRVYSIEISGFAFIPATLTISRGDSVRWINKDSVRHTVTSDSGSELNSPLLSKEEIYFHTFNTPGEYNYHCTPHPHMKAKIIVMQ
ncbi:MAG: cupredoxin family copper-binding protein [Candidatus Pacearchaeota archaeon]